MREIWLWACISIRLVTVGYQRHQEQQGPPYGRYLPGPCHSHAPTHQQQTFDVMARWLEAKNTPRTADSSLNKGFLKLPRARICVRSTLLHTSGSNLLPERTNERCVGVVIYFGWGNAAVF